MLTWLMMGHLDKRRKNLAFKPPVSRPKGEGEEAERYSTYTLTGKEKGFHLLLAGCLLFAAGYLFYKSFLIAAMCSCLALLYPRIVVKGMIRKRKEQLNGQFKQALYSLATSLSAGKSVENAFRDVLQDLMLLYPDPSTPILKEFRRIAGKLDRGETVEQALSDLSERADLDDIRSFTEVFVICKRSGGNLIEVMRRTSNMIGEKVEIKQEIQVLIAQKRFEAKVLGAAPLAIIALLSLSSPDYMAPLYDGASGMAIMTLSLILLAGCLAIIIKIMDIKV
ncbi:type II secretion system F family protein [Paenibacillus aurantius]|uniref:Type II secretion system F family protein n=1 Tax=Paenibacillus aurantius TaxID=2918900 RepID=A0AA96RFM0_9BACL|nr:type II secretion system F family protein [Paenibacillus aurantius]WNQ09134.1 type II secretion system F family protein [Paenibacillus aurantius]